MGACVHATLLTTGWPTAARRAGSHCGGAVQALTLATPSLFLLGSRAAAAAVAISRAVL
jgi:hypothetical protein